MSIILIIIGICILFYPKVSNYLVEKNQNEVIKQHKEHIQNLDIEELNKEYEKAEEYNKLVYEEAFNYHNDKEKFNSYEEILNLSKNGIMSYIEIPKISVNLPIYHGTENEVLEKGVGHIINTSLPVGGESTNCVLTGHTGLVKAKLFSRLNELEENDYFFLNTLGKKLVYKVYEIKVVLPTELEALYISDGKDLVTLVTCTPYGINTHRLLVKGERVTEQVEENEEIFNNIKSNYNKEVRYNNYYLIGVIIFCCILFKYIVKYKKKIFYKLERKR